MNKGGINIRLYFFIFSVLSIVGVWRGAEWINNVRLASLKVIEAPKVDMGGTSINAKSFYPAWVKQSVVQSAQAENLDSLDELFRKKANENNPSVAQAIPDYVSQFQQSIRVDGTTGSGIFINGKFYQDNDKLEGLAFRGEGGEVVVPQIVSLSRKKIVFKLGEKTLTMGER